VLSIELFAFCTPAYVDPCGSLVLDRYKIDNIGIIAQDSPLVFRGKSVEAVANKPVGNPRAFVLGHG
jgi:hypothetical protein